MKLEKKEKRKVIITYIIITVVGIALAIIAMLTNEDNEVVDVNTAVESQVEDAIQETVIIDTHTNKATDNNTVPEEKPQETVQQPTEQQVENNNTIKGFEARGAQIRCKLCGKEVYDGWDRGSNFGSIEELLAKHLNEEHGYNIDINRVDPNKWPEYTENGNPNDTIDSVQDYASRIKESEDMKSLFDFDYENWNLEMRETTY